jgi:hypothetical protein
MSYGDVVISFRVIEVPPGTTRCVLPKFCQPGTVLVINRNTVDIQVLPNPGGHFVGQGPDQPVTLGATMRASFVGVEAPPPEDLYASYRGYGIAKGVEAPA